MKATKAENSFKSKVKHLVPNNPAYDKEYNLDNGMDKDAIAYARANTLYDIFSKYGYRKTATGRFVKRDEPPEEIQYKQSDMIRKQLQQKRAAASRERLKQANKVPLKAGGRLFEDFCREAYRSTATKSAIVDLKNIYNAAFHLPYDKWIIFVADEYKNSRYKKA